MDPKQTGPQGGQPGGQEGQNVQPQFPGMSSSGAGSVGAGELGSQTLSTGANVSRTMDSLNSHNQESATGKSIFQKKKFDKVVAVSGDIILTIDPNDNKGQRKSLDKAKMIKFGGILGAIVAVVLLGAIILAFVTGSGKKEKTPGTQPTANLSMGQAFYQYSNYILFGTTSTTPTDETISLANTYEIDTILSAESEEKSSFFHTAKQYFDKFIESYNNSDEKNQSYILPSILPDYKNTFDFIYNYAQAGGLADSELLPIYSEEGESGLNTYFEENYNIFNESENEDSKEYYIYQKAYFDYRKAYYKVAQSRGCIEGGEIVPNCQTVISNIDVNSVMDGYNMANKIVGRNTDALITGASSIIAEIQNPTTEEDINEMMTKGSN